MSAVGDCQAEIRRALKMAMYIESPSKNTVESSNMEPRIRKRFGPMGSSVRSPVNSELCTSVSPRRSTSTAIRYPIYQTSGGMKSIGRYRPVTLSSSSAEGW